MSSSLLPAIGSYGRPQTPVARPGVGDSPSPSAVRSAVAVTPAEPEVVAVGSRTDGKLTLIDPATGKVSSTVDVGMAVQKNIDVFRRSVGWNVDKSKADTVSF